MSSEGEAGVPEIRSQVSKLLVRPWRAKKVSVRGEGFKNQFRDLATRPRCLTEGEAP